MKLGPFGIEFSAAIAGYSRYVMWVYIGVSGHSAVSVERSYLDCITSLGYQSRTVHAAKGTETALLESAHYGISLDTALDMVAAWIIRESKDGVRNSQWL
ncbi:hypothetical protein N7451_008528 [Penicillium sp. IBT 35674x]|nr:hypothetical protein N7451_008528 [Penicillium sp. IBT 35674x]